MKDLIIDFFANGEYEAAENIETDNQYAFCIKSKSIFQPSEEQLKYFTESVSQRDIVSIEINLDQGELVIYDLKNNYAEFISEIDSLNQVKDDEQFFFVRLIIEKKCFNQTVTIYDSNLFCCWLFENNTSVCLKKFLGLLKNFKFQPGFFECADDCPNYNTQYFRFVSTKNKITASNVNEGDYRNSLNKVLRHSQMGTSINWILPELFFLEERGKNELYNNIFDQLALLAGLASISNKVNLEDDIVEMELTTSTNFTTRFEAKNLKGIDDKIHMVFYSTYKWIYNGSEISDRLTIARNILSILIIDGRPIKLKQNLYLACKDTYERFLLDKVEKYFEVTQKLSEAVFIFIQKSDQVADSFITSFRATFLALAAFISTSILAKLFSANAGDNALISNGNFILLSLILTISSIFFALAYTDSKKRLEALEDNYKKLKDRYERFISFENSSLEYDNSIKTAINSTLETLSRYKFFWGGSILLCFIAISILWFFEFK